MHGPAFSDPPTRERSLDPFPAEHGSNRLQNVQNQNFGILMPKLVHNSLNHIFGEL
jgi:hypothetical protein